MDVSLNRIEPPQEEFASMYLEAFNDGPVPLQQVVFEILVDGERMAFCSVYAHSAGNLYLQHTGYLKCAKGSKYGIYVRVLDALHNLGFPFIMGAIDSRNTIALMWALRAGFKVNGCRQATDGTLYVEILRREQ